MSQDFSTLIRDDLKALKPYTPIVPFEVLSERLGRAPEEIIKLDANENPFGAAPKALEALRSGRFYNIYPDPEATELRRAISRFTGVSADHLLCGMGADELIDIALRVVLNPQDRVIDSPPSFGMYPFSTHVNSGQYISIPRTADFHIDIDRIEAAVQANDNVKVIFACSPNNPNGSMITDAELKRMLALPVLVMLDEAYIEFAAFNGYESRMNWVEQYPNLCVLRTFSKLAGLAGLRVGYGAFPSWLREQMLKIKQPYNVNVAADLAARGALEDPDWLSATAQTLIQERSRMFEAFESISYLKPLPSESNFILCEVLGRDAGELKLTLQNEYGILVRYYNKPMLSNYIRISCGRPQDTDRLLEVLTTLETRS